MKIGLQTWGSEGDVQPFIALAAGLVQAGHEVTLVVTDNEARDYSLYSQRLGFRLVTVLHPLEMSPEAAVQLWRTMLSSHLKRQVELLMEYGFDPAMQPMFEAAKELCAGNDLVVGHFFLYPLRVAAEKSATPIVTVNLVHSCQPSAQICPTGFPDLGAWSYPLGWRLARMVLNSIFLPRVNALRRAENLSPDTDVMQQTWVSDRLNLVAVSPSIVSPPLDWLGRHQVCGFLNLPQGLPDQPLPAGLEEFIVAGTPPVYFCFGSMMIHHLSYIQEMAKIWQEVVRRIGCRAIFQLPWDDLSEINVGDDGTIFKVQRSTHQTVFPRCVLIVHHGGSGTTQASLRAGRPSVVVAHIADQFFWGSELERLGVAGTTQTRKRLSAKRLARAILKVLASSEMTIRATAVGRSMAQENGVQTAVKLIEASMTR